MKVNGVAETFLRHGDCYLLMKRSAFKQHYPNVWAGVGGGIEPEELAHPRQAALREIWEETGVCAEHIANLRLRYLHISQQDGTLIYHYVYFGQTLQTAIRQTDEGALFWIPRQQFFDREFSPAATEILRHYFATGIDTKDLYVFTTNNGFSTVTPFGQEKQSSC